MKSQKLAIAGSSDSTLMSKYEASIHSHIKKRLSDLGWNLVFDRRAEEAECFDGMIPFPTITFSVADKVSGETRAVAFHFYESGDAIQYVCTMELSGRGQAEERGQFNKTTETLTVLTTHNEWRSPRSNLSAVRTAISVDSLKKSGESLDPEIILLPDLIAAQKSQAQKVHVRKRPKSTSTD